MASNQTYSVNFNATDVVAGILTVDFPLNVVTPLFAIIRYNVPTMPSFPVGVTKVSNTRVTVNAGECPDGDHQISIIYYNA